MGSIAKIILAILIITILLLAATNQQETPTQEQTPAQQPGTLTPDQTPMETPPPETVTPTQTQAPQEASPTQTQSPPETTSPSQPPAQGVETPTTTTPPTQPGVGLTLEEPPPFFRVEPREQTLIAPLGVPVEVNFTLVPYYGYEGRVRVVVLGTWIGVNTDTDPQIAEFIEGLTIHVPATPSSVPGVVNLTLVHNNSSYMRGFQVLLGFLDDENRVMDTAVLKVFPLRYPGVIAYIDSPILPLESGQVVVYPVRVEPLGEYNATVRLEARVEPRVGALRVSLENPVGVPPFTAFLSVNVSETYSMRWIDRVFIEVRDANTREGVSTLLVIKVGQGRPETRGFLAQLLDLFAAITLPIRFTAAVATGLVISGFTTPLTLDPSVGIVQVTRVITPELWLEGQVITDIRAGVPYQGQLISLYNTALLSSQVPAMMLTPWFTYPYPCNGSAMVPFLLYIRDDTRLEDLVLYAYLNYPQDGETVVRLNEETYPIRGVVEVRLPQGAFKASLTIGANTTDGQPIGSLSVMLVGGEKCLKNPTSLKINAVPGYSTYVPIEVNMPGRLLRVFDNPALDHLTGKLYVTQGRVTKGIMETPVKGYLEVTVGSGAEPGYYNANRPGDYITIQTDRQGLIRRTQTLIPVFVYVHNPVE